MSNFASLKKGSSSDNLTKALEATNKKFKKDERFWTLEVDKAGNGYAVIRFLDAPAVDGDTAVPFVQVFEHSFEGPGGWYIENSLTTLGQPDPVSEYNTKLWKTGIESNKKKARDQKRKVTYLSNILVVKDSAHPENDGKVFLFKYGTKIFDKIKSKHSPTEEEKGLAVLEDRVLETFNPFNFWKGANFKLRASKVEGYRNYDKSEFEAPKPVFAEDDKIEALWKSEFSLNEFLAPTNFKTYEELEAKFNKVLGLTPSGNKPRLVSADRVVEMTETGGDPSVDAVEEPVTNDETMSFFQKLAED